MTRNDCLDRAGMKTYRNNKCFYELQDKIFNYDSDFQQKERLKQQLCKHCFYIDNDRIAGQTFTEANCLSCDEEMIFPTTSTTYYCKDCAVELDVCIHCGGIID